MKPATPQCSPFLAAAPAGFDFPVREMVISQGVVNDGNAPAGGDAAGAV